MSVFRPIQHAFTAGEISPLFYAQQDAPIYQNGLKRCRNMIPLTQGGATSRPGTTFIAELDPADTVFPPTNARCIPIELNREDWSVLVMGGGSAVLINNTNIVSDQQVVLNPDFDDGLTDWDVLREGGTGSDGSAVPETIEFDEETVETIRIRSFLSIVPPVATIMSILQEATAVAGDEDMSFEYRLGHHASQQNNVSAQVTVSLTDFGVAPIYDQLHSIGPNDVDTVRVDLPGTAAYSGPLFIKISVLGADFPSIGHVHYCRCFARNVSAIPPDAFITPYTDDELA